MAKPITPRTKLILTARVTPTTATGNVTFNDSGHILATTRLTGGVATATVTGVYGGRQVLRATYTGEGNYTPSVSTGVSITVKDTTKPKVTGLKISTNPPPTASFKATDAGGVRSIRVRTRMSAPNSRKLGPWSAYTTLPGTATSWTIPAQGSRVKMCISVRATDYAGKVSTTHTKCATTK